MRTLVFFIILFTCSISINAQIDEKQELLVNDSIVPKQIGINEFYNTKFSIFDSYKMYKDTLYLHPIYIEPQITMIDSVRVKNQNSSFEKVNVNSYQVSLRNITQDFSYYRAPSKLDLDYDPTPKFEYTFPFDNLHIVETKKSYWTNTNELGLDISQSSFANWSAGGNNSISGLVRVKFTRNYEKGRRVWNNEFRGRFGLNKQDQREMRKTEDVLFIESTYGYQTSVTSRWFYTAKATINTQFSDGYAYPNTEKAISKFAAPLYMFGGFGAEYTSKNKTLKTHLSPSTLKSTFVMDETLANSGAFGVKPAVKDENGNIIEKGAYSRNEFGILVNATYKKMIFKNGELNSQVTLFTDYFNNFGNIDVDWQIQLEMKVNNFIKATISGHFIYDDDIQNRRNVDGVQIIEGPKLQIKQFIGIGLSYSL